MTPRECGLRGGVAILGAVVSYAFAGASNVMLVTLPMPVVALLLGSLILHEPVTGTALAGMALIGAGLLAIDGHLPRGRRAPAVAARSGAA
jgi:drug/metabolite transporter (DMT)-like permease